MADPILIEQVTTAHRASDRDGTIRAHPAWHDLDEAGRVQAFDDTVVQRRMEAALDPQGRTTTVFAVLARLRGPGTYSAP